MKECKTEIDNQKKYFSSGFWNSSSNFGIMLLGHITNRFPTGEKKRPKCKKKLGEDRRTLLTSTETNNWLLCMNLFMLNKFLYLHLRQEFNRKQSLFSRSTFTKKARVIYVWIVCSTYRMYLRDKNGSISNLETRHFSHPPLRFLFPTRSNFLSLTLTHFTSYETRCHSISFVSVTHAPTQRHLLCLFISFCLSTGCFPQTATKENDITQLLEMIKQI